MMPVYVWIIIAVAVVLIAAAAVVLLRKKGGKKDERELLLESRRRVGDNAQSVDVLLVLASGKDEMTDKLKALQEKLKYLSPSADEKVKAIDEKIRQALDDVKIELTKSKGSKDAARQEDFWKISKFRLRNAALYRRDKGSADVAV